MMDRLSIINDDGWVVMKKYHGYTLEGCCCLSLLQLQAADALASLSRVTLAAYDVLLPVGPTQGDSCLLG